MQVLLFADDTVLVTAAQIRALQTAVKEHKLAVNWTKTNTMAIGRKGIEGSCGNLQFGSKVEV